MKTTSVTTTPCFLTCLLKTSSCSSFSPPNSLLLHPPLSFSSTPTLTPHSHFPRFKVHCSTNSGGNESKAILDAFFLGKAVAEALTERFEASVGEFFSVVGQWQAEQRKQVLDLQDEVFERAKKAKEKAALEALGEKGTILRPTAASMDTETLADAETPIVATPSSNSNNSETLPDTKEK